MKILLIGQDLMLSRAIKLLLCSHGHQVCATGNGRSALEIIDRQTIDLIISETTLPDISGVAFSRLLYNYYSNFTPILLLSLPEEKLLTSGKTLPETADVLEKPFGFEQLMDKIRKISRTRKTAKAQEKNRKVFMR